MPTSTRGRRSKQPSNAELPTNPPLQQTQTPSTRNTDTIYPPYQYSTSGYRPYVSPYSPPISHRVPMQMHGYHPAAAVSTPASSSSLFTAASSIFSESDAGGENDIKAQNEAKRLDGAARVFEEQIAYVNEGIKVNMQKLESINKAHLTIGTLLTRESRALANQSSYTHRLSGIHTRISELESTPNAISDPNLREEFTLLQQNKAMLEKMLEQLPNQLAVIRQSIPLAVTAAREEEAKVGEILGGLGQWRGLAGRLETWRMEGEGQERKIVLLEGGVGRAAK